MKTILKIYSTISFLFLITATCVGNGGEVEKTKSYSKTYPLSAGDKVKLENRFGKLRISTWDKSEIKVDVLISTKANSEERAQHMLDRISIRDKKSSQQVSFETVIENDTRKWEKGGSDNFNIDYEVYLPSKTPLNASNEFGSTTIADYTGELSLTSKYGSLSAGKLTNSKIVTVEFGSAAIEGVNNGSVIIKYSSAVINKLDGTVKANFEFCSGVKVIIDNQLKDLNIRNSYTTLYLDAKENLSASFDIYTNYGSFSNKSNFGIEKDKSRGDGMHFDERYSGKAGGGIAPLKIRSEFGSIVLGHNLKMEMKGKKDKDAKDKKKEKQTDI